MEARNTVRLGRRAMLAATLGGVAAAAGALASPTKVLAANGDPVLVGGNHTGSNRTALTCTADNTGLLIQSNGHGVQGTTNGPTNRFGVYGVAFQAGSAGVSGLNSASGCGGALGTGYAGVVAGQGGAALALDVQGKARFSRSGVATIPAGQRFVQVDVEGLTASSFAVATLQQYRANLWVQSITVSASSASIYIYVSQRAPQATRVAWMVFEKLEIADFS
jgi:hypothetical protein